MFHALYTIIIYPLYQIIELFFTLCDAVFKNTGIAIIGVSMAVSFLCLPLYVIAEKWQETERQIQKKLKPGVDRIKAVFKGDEQYMILSTYYRQNHYHPAMALRSSISLLIQIPFFIAAYNLLSTLETLQGCSFLFIRDLGKPDALFNIGAFSVNVLPIAMTLINIVSGIIYSRGHPVKEQIQIYVLALFFLVFLYDSPSGLVLYWTLNNVFSLVKNIFYKFKKPLKVLWFCLTAGYCFIVWYLLFRHGGFLYRRLTLCAVLSCIPLSPLFLKFFTWLIDNPLAPLVHEKKKRTFCFIIICLATALLCGFTLPSFVVSSSPTEFSFIDEYTTPFSFIWEAFFQNLGFYAFWPLCLYFLFNERIQSLLTLLMAFILFSGTVNTFAFDGDYGTISTILTFTNPDLIPPDKLITAVSLLITLLILVLLIFIFKKNCMQYCSSFACILLFAFICISVVNSSKITDVYNDYTHLRQNNHNQKDEVEPVFHLSKTGQNIIYIFLDRACGGFIPYLFEEKPEFNSQFDGFTYYPNTVSFAPMTLCGAPAVYGGYEYTPFEINKRDTETLVSKHNEALSVLPVLFSSNGFDTTVTDISWANYSWISDLSIFDEYPEIHQEPTLHRYTDLWQKEHKDTLSVKKQSTQLIRNFFWLSLFKIMTPVLRETIYDDGHWWAARTDDEYVADFLNNYAVLDYLPELTDTINESNTFIILANDATHEPVMTGYPDYDLMTKDVGPYPLDNDSTYNVNAAALCRLGEFFDYLRESGVYDSTRIVICSDHGAGSSLTTLRSEAGLYDNIEINPEPFNPLLLMKDFNAHGPLITDDSFMTNADVPIMITEGIIQNAVNPFTGKILSEQVQKEKVFIEDDAAWTPEEHGSNTFTINRWYSVHDDILTSENWAFESPYDFYAEDVK